MIRINDSMNFTVTESLACSQTGSSSNGKIGGECNIRSAGRHVKVDSQTRITPATSAH